MRLLGAQSELRAQILTQFWSRSIFWKSELDFRNLMWILDFGTRPDHSAKIFKKFKKNLKCWYLSRQRELRVQIWTVYRARPNLLKWIKSSNAGLLPSKLGQHYMTLYSSRSSRMSDIKLVIRKNQKSKIHIRFLNFHIRVPKYWSRPVNCPNLDSQLPLAAEISTF